MGRGKLGPRGYRYMALRLRVISDHRHRLGDKSTFVFGVSGGSIGRSAENDWVLPDDMRYVSGRHARIVFHKGRYLLQDTSSNGTYVNDNERPLGNQNPHELKSGDILRIGEYHVQVQIDSATDFSLDDSALYARHGLDQHPPRACAAEAISAPRCASRICSKPATTFRATSSSRSTPSARRCRRARARCIRPRTCRRKPSTAPELDVDSEAVARRIARLAKAADQAAGRRCSNRHRRPLPPRRRRDRIPRRRRTTTRRACRRSAAARASDPRRCPSMRTRACCISPASCCANRCSVSRKAIAASRNNATSCA